MLFQELEYPIIKMNCQTRKIFIKLLLIILLFFLVFNSINADTENTNIQKIIITASAEMPFDEISVITANEIKSSSARNISEIIEGEAGIDVEKRGGITQSSFISIRGGNPEELAVYINGIRVSERGSSFDISSIPLSDIKRIEIKKSGSGTDLKGSVNIITESINKPSLSAGVLSGPFNGISIFTSSSLPKIMPLDTGIRISSNIFYNTRNFYFYDILTSSYRERKNTGMLSWNPSINFKSLLNESISLNGYLNLYLSKRGIPGIYLFPTKDALMKDLRIIGNLMSIITLKCCKIKLGTNLIRNSREYRDISYFLGPIYNYHRTLTASLFSEFSSGFINQFLSLQIIFGTKFIFDSLISNALLENASLNNGKIFTFTGTQSGKFALSLFIFTNKKYGRLNIKASYEIFYDKLYSFLPSFNGALTYIIDKNKKYFIRLTGGYSFRPPSFNDLFWSSGAFATGNPNLIPEKGWNLDLLISLLPFKFFRIKVSAFYNPIQNYIQWLPGPAGRWMPHNTGDVIFTGGEIEAGFIFNIKQFIFSLTGNYSLLFASDKSHTINYNRQLPNKPFEKANIKFNFSIFNIGSLKLLFKYRGFRFITAGNTKYISEYFTFDFTLNFNFIRYFKVKLSIINLLDASYIDLRDYPVPGREFNFGISFKLKK